MDNVQNQDGFYFLQSVFSGAESGTINGYATQFWGRFLIITRYLVKQVVSTTAVVVALLTLIMMGSSLIRYFGVAAQGRIDAGVLLTIMAYRFPEFLTLLLPVGFFIGLMLVFGRLYVDHEMAVLNSSGVSRGQLGGLLFPLTLAVFLFQAFLMMWLAPAGVAKYEQVMTTQAMRSGFDLVRPREFISSGPYTIYAGDLSEDRQHLKDIFFYQKAKSADKPDTIIVAKEARRVSSMDDTVSTIDLYQGRRYSMIPGQPKYLQAEFENYRLQVEIKTDQKQKEQSLEAMSMWDLWQKYPGNPVIISELGWRFFAPFVVLIALILALPLSEVSPRQGRYYRLFPAIMLFASLVVALMAVKIRISKDQLGVWAYVAVLAIYTALAWFFNRKQDLSPKIKRHFNQGKPAA